MSHSEPEVQDLGLIRSAIISVLVILVPYKFFIGDINGVNGVHKQISLPFLFKYSNFSGTLSSHFCAVRAFCAIIYFQKSEVGRKVSFHGRTEVVDDRQLAFKLLLRFIFYHKGYVNNNLELD